MPDRIRRRGGVLAALVGTLLLLLSGRFAASSRCGSTLTVTSLADSGAGTLRQAILDSNCVGDTIVFSVTGTIGVGSTLAVPHDLTIQGPGAGQLTLQYAGATNYPIVRILNGAAVTISGLTITGGVYDGGGSAVDNEGGTLTLDGVLVTGNSGSSAVFNNIGSSAGTGAMVIVNSTLSGNTSSGDGGALTDAASTASLTIKNSTISGNTANGNGGGLLIAGPNATLVSVTITANQAADGGGISAGSSAALLYSTIVAGNTRTQNGGAPDVSGLLSLNSFANLIGDGTGTTGVSDSVNGNQIGVGGGGEIDARLGPLQNNGGPMPTHALLANSPALDRGSPASTSVYGLTVDQRGVTRVLAGPGTSVAAIDVGAVEAQASLRFGDVLVNEDTTSSPGFQVGSASLITSVTASSGNQTVLPDGSYSVIGSGASRSLLMTPAPNQHGVVPVTVTVTAGSESVQGTMNVNVLDIPDTSSVSSATTNEDTQTSSGLVLDRNATDGTDVAWFYIFNITHGALYQHDGITSIANGAFITYAQGHAGLRFTPDANYFGTASFQVLASTAANVSGLGTDQAAATATITVNPVADTPTVTDGTAFEDFYTGLQITSNAADGLEITHFHISGISGGTMLQSDGVTPINDGDFVPIPSGTSGITVLFTPFPDSNVTGHFTVRASIGATVAGLSAGSATSTITVTPLPDKPTVTPATTFVNHQTTTGLRVQKNAVDGPEITHFLIGPINSGRLYLQDGTTELHGGDFITVAQGDAGLRFTPDPDFSGTGSFSLYASIGTTGSDVSVPATALITINKYDTATTITSHTPNPVDQGRTITVGFSVVGTNGGPAPTGLVQLSLGDGSYYASVANGTGTVVATSAGNGQTLTATYLGDLSSNGSVGTALQDVRACAAEPTVTTTADSGPGSLRQVVSDICDDQQIGFDIPGPGPHTIVLTSGPIATSRSIGIFGSFDKSIRISGNHASRVFDFSGDQDGLVLVTVMDGLADSGAGVRATGYLTLAAVTLSGNVATADGGAVWGDGPDSLVSLDTSTLSGNGAPNGSAIRADGLLGIAASTITANSGGGAAVLNGGLTLTFNSILAGNDGAPLANADTSVWTDLGGTMPFGDPKLGPLQDNGGPTFTHMPLAGSPAIDGGSLANFFTELIDQRGFSRFAGRNGDPVPLPDVGAVEVTPTVDAMASQSTAEDTPLAVAVGVGSSFYDPLADAVTSELDSIVATSSDQSVVSDMGLVVTGSGEARTLTITPAANRSGTVTITVTATSTVPSFFVDDVTVVSTSSSFTLTVTPVADTPSVTSTTTPIDQQSTNGLVVTRNPADGAEVTHYQVTGISGGSLFQHDGVTPIGEGAFITAAEGAAGLRFTPAPDSLATGHFSVQASIGATVAGLGGGVVTADVFIGALTAIEVTSSSNPSSPGSSVTIQAVVTPSIAGVPTGTVTFSDGATVLGTVPLASGVAAFTTSTLRPGTHHLTIAYGGDTSFAASSAAFDQSVISASTVLTGADAGGGPHVRRFTAIGGATPASGVLNSFFAYDPTFGGGVRVAQGDVNGDGVPDVIVGAGPGGWPEVRIFDGASGALVRSFLAYEPEFQGGVYVAAADVNGDGYADVITGSGSGRAGEVKVFSGGGPLIADLPVFAPAFTGGVRVAAADVNGDGRADLVVGSGPGMPAEVRVLDGATAALLRTLNPYGAFAGGVFVAAGDVTGDGVADLVTGAGEGGGPHVRVFDGATGVPVASFFAFDPSFTGGARVAVGDVDDDGRAEVIVGSGPGRVATVRVFDAASAALLSEVTPYDGFPNGVFVATTAPINRLTVDTLAPGSTVSGPLWIAGWGFIDNPANAGLEAIHVWALPVGGGAPVFLGLATLGIARPDIAALFGDQYAAAGYSLNAPALAPGVYDIAVFGQSALTGTFPLLRVVRVTITP